MRRFVLSMVFDDGCDMAGVARALREAAADFEAITLDDDGNVVGELPGEGGVAVRPLKGQRWVVEGDVYDVSVEVS